MSKLLRKLLSAAIFPAALLVVSKLAGIYLANRIFDLGWYIQTDTGGLFSVQLMYPDEHSAVFCNSFSNATMVFAMIIGAAVSIFQAYFLHESHQNPRVLVKLIQFDFVMWMAETANLFPRLVTWLTFLWIASIISIVQAIQSTSYEWIAIVGFVASVVATGLAVRDFEREMKTILPENDRLKVA